MNSYGVSTLKILSRTDVLAESADVRYCASGRLGQKYEETPAFDAQGW
jgi:hypothetical protein